MGTANLLEAVRSAQDAGGGPRVVVIVTSDKCYENSETGTAFVETRRPGRPRPYSASKACAELLAAAYRRSFLARRLAGRRHSQGGQRASAAETGARIACCQTACGRATPARRWSCVRRHPVRPWQHVLEPLAGYLCLASSLWQGLPGTALDPQTAHACAWNFGPGAASWCAVREIVEGFHSGLEGGEWQAAPSAADQPHEARLLALDAAKASDLLGWRPVWGPQEAVARAASWYRAFARGEDAQDLRRRVRDDIDGFVADARDEGAAWVSA